MAMLQPEPSSPITTRSLMAFSFLAVLRDLRAILKGEGVGLDQPKEAVVQCEPLADVHRGPTVSAMLPSRTAEPKKASRRDA